MLFEIIISKPQLRITFSEYITPINTRDQQAIFKNMVFEIYLGECSEDHKGAKVMLEGPDKLYMESFYKPKTKSIVNPLVVFMKE